MKITRYEKLGFSGSGVAGDKIEFIRNENEEITVVVTKKGHRSDYILGPYEPEAIIRFLKNNPTADQPENAR